MHTRSDSKRQPGDGAGLLHAPEAERLRAAAAADAAAPREEFLFAPPAALHKPLAALLADPRDLPILFLYLNVLLTTAPAAAALFTAFPPATRPLPHWLGAAYLLASYAAYLARFMLSLHYSSHRSLFRRGALFGCWGAGPHACTAPAASALCKAHPMVPPPACPPPARRCQACGR